MACAPKRDRCWHKWRQACSGSGLSLEVRSKSITPIGWTPPNPRSAPYISSAGTPHTLAQNRTSHRWTPHHTRAQYRPTHAIPLLSAADGLGSTPTADPSSVPHTERIRAHDAASQYRMQR
eukprot:543592-Rhodomonas_salina.1